MVNIYDYVIVGSGISGLYFAHLLKDKTDNFIILEKKEEWEAVLKLLNMNVFGMKLEQLVFLFIINIF